jgi:hypothetical protein
MDVCIPDPLIKTIIKNNHTHTNTKQTGVPVPRLSHGAARPHLCLHGATQDQVAPRPLGHGRGGVDHGRGVVSPCLEFVPGPLIF